MAVWQVPIILLPLDDFYVEDDEYIFKENFIISSVSIEELRRVLKKRKSWCDNIKQYGDLESTNIEFYYENQKLISITLRIDVTNIKLEVIKSIIKFCVINNLRFCFNDVIYAPTLENIKTIINNSPAYKFISNPKKFLEDIS